MIGASEFKSISKTFYAQFADFFLLMPGAVSKGGNGLFVMFLFLKNSSKDVSVLVNDTHVESKGFQAGNENLL